MTRNSFSPISFPSPTKTIWLLLALLFSFETVIMWVLPYVVHESDGHFHDFLDASCLTVLFFPFLYRYLFVPFQKIATLQQSITENLMAHLVDGVIIFDEKGEIHTINSAAEEIFGYQAEELVGDQVKHLLAGSSRGDFMAAVAACAGGERGSNRELCGVKSGGAEVPLDLSLSRIQSQTGWLLMAIVRDISERKKAEEELKKALALLKATLESTGDGILVRDLQGKSMMTNQRFAEMWRVPRAMIDAGNENAMRLHVADQLVDPQGFLALAESQYQDPTQVTKHLLEFKDGRVFERVSVPHVVEKEIVGRLICFRDITEQKKLEQQLRHAQKMEALGTLAGGVAHDFNNILTVIIGYCDLIVHQIPGNATILHDVDQILAASERASSLTKSLLAYSRKGQLDIRPVHLNQTVTRFHKFLKRLIGEDIDLVTNCCQENLMILADSGQIEQLLMNLAANAKDAMNGSGCLVITTSRLVIDEAFVRLHGFGKQGIYALLTVSDTGSGMDEATREKIFEPFFTTKRPGEGTGLGLSIAYGIVKQHDGHINVYSEPDKGTTFNIYLPVTRENIELPKLEPPPVRGANETLLLCEDDPGVRILVKNVLCDAGYRVIEAVDGEEAVKIFKERRETIDLLLFDLIMPKKNGREAYNEISALRPEAKVIFMSGYTADIIEKNGMVDSGLVLLNKPLSPNQLLNKVGEMLQQP